MNPMFEEIAWEQTSIGELVLRRRRLTPEGEDIWEIKLNDGYLMSSQFVDGEIALADLALAFAAGDDLDVVIGGLGLGYTAQAVLRDSRVAKLTVVELIPQVIDWHRAQLLPLGKAAAGDPRCILRQGDFFALASEPDGFDPEAPDKLHDAILIDIDHSTVHFIDDASADFYSADAISAITANLKPGGIFALWSTDAEDAQFVATLRHSLRSGIALEKSGLHVWSSKRLTAKRERSTSYILGEDPSDMSSYMTECVTIGNDMTPQLSSIWD